MQQIAYIFIRYKEKCISKDNIVFLKFNDVPPLSRPGAVPRQAGVWNIKASLREFRHQNLMSDLFNHGRNSTIIFNFLQPTIYNILHFIIMLFFP